MTQRTARSMPVACGPEIAAPTFEQAERAAEEQAVAFAAGATPVDEASRFGVRRVPSARRMRRNSPIVAAPSGVRLVT